MLSTNEAHRGLIHSFMAVMRTTETWAFFLCTKKKLPDEDPTLKQGFLMVEQTKQTNFYVTVEWA